MQKETNRANFLDGPDNPAGKENQRHGEGHVEVGIRPAKKRLFHLKTVRAVMAPSDIAKKRNQPGPIGEQDKNKDGRKKPKRLAHQRMANNAFKKIMQTFDHPFPEILRAFG